MDEVPSSSIIGRVRGAGALCCFTIGFVLFCLGSAASAQDDLRPVFRPHGPCFPVQGKQVIAHAWPDLGGAEPTVLVLSTATVHLSGIARSYFVRENCTTGSSPLRFAWTLTARSRNGIAIDATNLLKGANTLFPTFESSEATTYVAQLTAGGETNSVRIEALTGGRTWYSIGPNGSVGGDGIGNPSVGRVNDLVFDPADPATIYAATAQGGVFKTVDRGGTWFPVTDHVGLPNLGISTLAVSPGPIGAVLYAAIGDNRQNSRVAIGSGKGIWRSRNGGASWASAAPALGTSCPPGSNVFAGNANRILVSPQNSSIVYAAAQQGLFRSLDGGDCWTSIGSLPAVSDIAFDPSNPQTLYLAVPQSGIFKTTTAPTATTLPSAPILSFPTPNSWVALALAPSAPSLVYAAVANAAETVLVASADGGKSWTQTASGLCNAQCSFGIALAVDPTDPNHVVFGEVKVHHSVDGGTTFSGLGAGGVHDDFHALVFAPDNPRIIYAGTDGGVFRNSFSSDSSHTPGAMWEPRNLELSVAQAPTLAWPSSNQEAAAIGVWDNGTQVRVSGRTWKAINNGDGFVVAADATSGEIIYYNDNAGTSPGNATSRYPDGASFGNVTAVVANPFVPGELFGIGVAGKSDNKWYVTRGANQSAPNWICADLGPAGVPSFSFDFSVDGSYYSSSQNGSIFRFRLPAVLPNVPLCTPTSTAAIGAVIFAQAGTSIGIRISLAVDPFDANALYVLVLPGGTVSSVPSPVIKITKSIAGIVTGGSPKTVTPIGSSLSLPPGVQLTAIGADPAVPGLVYVGTTNGIWEGLPDSSGAYSWTQNLTVPDTYIAGIVPHRGSSFSSGYSGALRVTTYGRGVWERQITVSRTCLALHCLAPRKITCVGCHRAAYQTPPVGDNFEAWIAIPYFSKVDPGDRSRIRVTPLRNGEPQPYFLIEGNKARKGDNLAFALLRYAGRDAPLGLQTTSLRVELLRSPEGPVLASETVDFRKWWARPDARLLTVSSLSAAPLPESLPVTVKIILDSRVIEGKAPLTVPIPLGARVAVQVEPNAQTRHGMRSFDAWSLGEMAAKTDPRIDVVVTDNTLLTAHYRSH